MKFRSNLMRATAASLLFVGCIATANATTYTYELNGSLADSTGGGSNLLTHGGSLGTTGYSFDSDTGLSLSNIGGAAFNSWSIGISFYFSSDTTPHGGSGYRRILDFLSSTTDNGLYSRAHDVDFYPESYGGQTNTGILTNNVLSTVSISRNAAGTVTVDAGGGNTFSFSDTGSLANFTPTSTLNFFIDDFAVPGESTSGFVDRIVIETNAVNGVPEPSTWAMMILGFAGVGFMAYRRRFNSSLAT